MYSQGILVQDKFVSNRLINFKLVKDRQLDFSDFEELLNFDEKPKHKSMKVLLEKNNNLPAYNNEKIILSHDDFLLNKEEVERPYIEVLNITEEEISSQKEVEDENIDKDNQNINELISMNTIESDEILDYLKKEIRYYENKLETTYNLEGFEREELKLFELRQKTINLRKTLMKLKNNKYNNQIEKNNLILFCKNEIFELERQLNLNYKIDNSVLLEFSNINDLDNVINNNIKSQNKIVKEIENRVLNISNKLKPKMYLCMLKRMTFNLFKMVVGTYTIETSKTDYLQLTVGSFLVLNSILGIREAINLKKCKIKYYKYSDYSDSILSDNDNIELSKKILNKSMLNLNKLKKDLSVKFSNYKDYIHDYEEIYFKIDTIKGFLERKNEQIQNIYV